MRKCGPSRSKASCGTDRIGRLASFDDLVDNYRKRNQQREIVETAYVFQGNDFKEIVDRSVKSKFPYTGDIIKMHPHQYRIGAQKLNNLASILVESIDYLQVAPNFDALYQEIERIVVFRSIVGIGPLTIYDIACRIGSCTNRTPDKVYLHAGAAAGARHLKIQGKTAPVEAFPPSFAALSADDIESLLCVYAADIQRIVAA